MASIPQTLWDARIPLVITHASAPAAPPFVAAVPRFGYLALLLPRLAAFFGAACSSFHAGPVQLRNLAAGLLVDLYRPPLPWRLTVADGVAWDIADTFLNAAKEADFVRYGNANQIMKMSKDHTTQLWNAVVDNDYAAFARVNARLLDAPSPLKHVPVRIYLPAPPHHPPPDPAPEAEPPEPPQPPAPSFRVFQSLVPAAGPDRSPRLLGQALRDLAPQLFPGGRDLDPADVLLHGTAVPFEAPLEELMKEAAYPDGWLCFVVVS